MELVREKKKFPEETLGENLEEFLMNLVRKLFTNLLKTTSGRRVEVLVKLK